MVPRNEMSHCAALSVKQMCLQLMRKVCVTIDQGNEAVSMFYTRAFKQKTASY